MIWTLAFWKGAGERAFKTLAQALLAVFVVGVPIFEVDVKGALAIAATAVAASLLTSVLNADFTAGGAIDPRFVPETTFTHLPDGTVIENRYRTPGAAEADMGDSFRDVVAEGHQRARGE